jgi:hypothetical protein
MHSILIFTFKSHQNLIYTGQKKLRIISLYCFQKKFECNFDHLFSPYFLPYVDNTVMLPVGLCISWVNDYTNEY